ncbi:MAG: hypothetical protein HY013_00940, partial [Candidatus Solibacter usitatus]|nr:hypothetical protein [Candidatus Solibacter usitatus]
RSQGFQSLLPRDGRANFSGMIYHNLGSTLGALADTAGRVLDPRQREIVEGISKGMKPTLFTLQGEADSIRIATNGSLVGMTLDNLAGLQGPLSVMQMIGGKKRPRQLQ